MSPDRTLFLAACSAPDQICINILQAIFPNASPPVIHNPYQICNSINISKLIQADLSATYWQYSFADLNYEVWIDPNL